MRGHGKEGKKKEKTQVIYQGGREAWEETQ